MNKSKLTIKEYQSNIETGLNGSVVVYADCKYIAMNTCFKEGITELYSGIGSAIPCHIVEIDLVEFV